jgi:hypothetical protein
MKKAFYTMVIVGASLFMPACEKENPTDAWQRCDINNPNPNIVGYYCVKGGTPMAKWTKKPIPPSFDISRKDDQLYLLRLCPQPEFDGFGYYLCL